MSADPQPSIQHWTRDMEKQVESRTNIVLGDPMLLSVFQKFGAGVFRRSSAFHGLAAFLAAHKVRGTRCFEIGTWNGLTAALLSRHFDEVVTVDIAHNPIKHRIIEHLGIRSIRCVDIADNRGKWKTLRGLYIDGAYLDGNHNEDTESDFDLVRRSGQVIFHECWPFQSPVWSLVHALPAEEVVFGGCGLALWRRAE